MNNIPICGKCYNKINPRSFCIRIHLNATKHIYYYCSSCRISSGYPVSCNILASLNIKYEDLPTYTKTISYGSPKPSEKYKDLSYEEYLKTDWWKALSHKVKRRARFRCSLCNNEGLLNVHHRTYGRLGKEELKDLICLCNTCHETFHDRLRLAPN